MYRLHGGGVWSPAAWVDKARKGRDLEPAARDERVERFREETYRLSPFASPTHEVEAELAARRERLEASVRPAPDTGPETPEDFLE